MPTLWLVNRLFIYYNFLCVCMYFATNVWWIKNIHYVWKRQNLTEEQGDSLLVGRRQRLTTSSGRGAGGHVLYHVGVSASNASSGFSGHYQCVVERQNDRLFAIATVAVRDRKPPLPQIPQIELNFCHPNNYNRWRAHLHFTMKKASRSRCRNFQGGADWVAWLPGTCQVGRLVRRPGRPLRHVLKQGVERIGDLGALS